MNNDGTTTTQVTDVNAQMQGQATQQQFVQPQVQTQPQQQNNQALFTQEQLNSIVSGRVNPLNQRIQDLNTQLQQQQALANSYLNELTGFKQRAAAKQVGIPDQFVDFAVFEANKLAVNGKSFETAISEYYNSNLSLFGVSQNNGQAVQTTSPVVTDATQAQGNPAQTVMQQPIVTQQQNVQQQNVQQQQNTQQQPMVTQLNKSIPNVQHQAIPIVNQQAAQQQNNTNNALQQGTVGSTGTQGNTNTQGANPMEASVNAFLANRKAKKF